MASPSIGDIVTVVNTMRIIVDAIRESSEASLEYEELIMDIDSFCETLQSVQQVLALPRAYADPGIRQVAGRIHAEVRRVHLMINNLIRRMVPHHKALNSAAHSTQSPRQRFSLKVVIHRLFWTLFKKEDIAKARDALFRHTSQISIHMNALYVLLGNDTGRDIGLPIAKGDGLEIVGLDGKSGWINWDLCRNPEAFCSTLKIYLEHKPGQEFLKWKGLALYEDGGSNLALEDPSHWRWKWKKVRPGMKMFLSMPQWITVEGRPEYHPCTRPTCGRLLDLKSTLSGGRVDCFCGRIYHVHFIENEGIRVCNPAHIHHMMGYPRNYVDYSSKVDNVHLFLEDIYNVSTGMIEDYIKDQDREYMVMLHNYLVKKLRKNPAPWVEEHGFERRVLASC